MMMAALLFAVPVYGHELRPAYLELREESSGTFNVLFKTPMRGEMRLALTPVFSGQTEPLTPVITRRTADAAVQTWRLRAVEPLRGQSVGIDGLQGTMTDALVRAEFLDGMRWTQRLTPGQPAAAIPARQSAFTVAAVYGRLGVEHILTGIDHLLFVLALILITRTRMGARHERYAPEPGAGATRSTTWRLVKTVTAFTVSHSITLTAATLGWVQVPSAPVEAMIALSIVFVAAEILHLREGRVGIAARAPWVVAFSFGLLHGLGFAGGLSEAGLPAGQIPAALLFFSAGVEVGHLLFVATVLGMIELWSASRKRLVSRAGNHVRDQAVAAISNRWSRLAEFVPPYAIGSVAMFWVIERVASF
jgi:hypothetical protein